MFRFSIRDVLCLTMLVALATCWYMDRTAADRSRELAEQLASEKKANAKRIEELRFINAVQGQELSDAHVQNRELLGELRAKREIGQHDP
jgi:hypothetical protein